MSAMHSFSVSKRFKFVGLIFLICIITTVAWGISSRNRAHATLEQEARNAAILHVNVVHPIPEKITEELILPGTLQAWIETPVYAHTSGYLKSWAVDMGQMVTAGQLIAEIATPEIDQQALQATADLNTAIANAQLADITDKRYDLLLPTKTISQQDFENVHYDALAKQAAVVAARDSLARYQQLSVYKKIVAPYSGMITARNIDVGTMIDTGTANGKARELFHLSDISKLRAYIPAPESLAELIHEGDSVPINVRGRANKYWNAKCTNTAHAVDPVTHTVLIELQLENPQGTLLPGSYIEAHFKQYPATGTVTLPVNALIFNAQGTFMAVVLPNNTVHLQPIILGQNLGRDLEVIQGLSTDQQVIISPPDDIHEGAPVTPILMAHLQRKPS